MSQKRYRHINEAERLKIYKLLFEGHSLQTIAHHLGGHKPTIYRELYRNSTKMGYRPDFASQQYLLRRRNQLSKIDRSEEVKSYVLLKLREGWSPEQTDFSEGSFSAILI